MSLNEYRLCEMRGDDPGLLEPKCDFCCDADEVCTICTFARSQCRCQFTDHRVQKWLEALDDLDDPKFYSAKQWSEYLLGEFEDRYGKCVYCGGAE